MRDSATKSRTKQRYRKHLFICKGKTCSQRHDPEKAKAFFKEKIREAGMQDEARVCTCSCLDHCEFGPNMVVYPDATWYDGVKPEDWEEIFESDIKGGRPVARLRCDDGSDDDRS